MNGVEFSESNESAGAAGPERIRRGAVEKGGSRGAQKHGERTYIPNEYYELKTRIHDRLIDLIDLSLLDTVDSSVLKPQIRRLVEKILHEDERRIPLNMTERERLFQEIQDEVFGLGPLEPFLQDPTVSDILVNGYRQIYVERYGKLELTEARFKDDTHLRKIIDRIVSAVGRRVDESSPMVDARLPDGSRVNAIIPPLALHGSAMSIRRFSKDPSNSRTSSSSRPWCPRSARCSRPP